MTDPIADMLTRLRNAVIAKHPRVDVPVSKLKVEIARILEDEGYIQGFKLVDAYGVGDFKPVDGGYELKVKSLFFSKNRGAIMLRMDAGSSWNASDAGRVRIHVPSCSATLPESRR